MEPVSRRSFLAASVAAAATASARPGSAQAAEGIPGFDQMKTAQWEPDVFDIHHDRIEAAWRRYHDEIAEKEEISMSEIIREAIQEKLSIAVTTDQCNK